MPKRYFTNPVHDKAFPDPFVWKHDGIYYAIGTAPPLTVEESAAPGNERVFPLLSSVDFVEWREEGRALVRPDPAFGHTFWAPEIAFHEGIFYLYYSVGHEDDGHQLRVATSDCPLGPYRDVGSLLDPATHPFAIDPHPFRDDDGTWYLFFARDFLDCGQVDPFGSVRAGTAIVVERLDKSMTRLAGPGQVVLRARADWQRYLADRMMYGQAYDWHTLEGPCVRKHDGRYYCFYSGGSWQTAGYGLDYGVADHVLGPYSDAGCEAGARVLQSAPDHAIGPGHNSIVVGPDGSSEYVAYHAWDKEMRARRMFLDRLVWTPEGPRCTGPTRTPQQVDAGNA